MNDRELLAAAQLACEREVWDRCINTSDRTRQRGRHGAALSDALPRSEVVAQAREIGLDPAYVYGLIRQESRFIMDARSQRRRLGADAGDAGHRALDGEEDRPGRTSPSMITDRDVNLRLGTGYLKLVLDDFDGSQAMAAAAYNAGPGRPRRWREGPLLEPAAWAENIPFNETRDYVKKVLSNAGLLRALLGSKPAVAEGPAGPARSARATPRAAWRQRSCHERAGPFPSDHPAARSAEARP